MNLLLLPVNGSRTLYLQGIYHLIAEGLLAWDGGIVIFYSPQIAFIPFNIALLEDPVI